MALIWFFCFVVFILNEWSNMNTFGVVLTPRFLGCNNNPVICLSISDRKRRQKGAALSRQMRFGNLYATCDSYQLVQYGFGRFCKECIQWQLIGLCITPVSIWSYPPSIWIPRSESCSWLTQQCPYRRVGIFALGLSITAAWQQNRIRLHQRDKKSLPLSHFSLSQMHIQVFGCTYVDSRW